MKTPASTDTAVRQPVAATKDEETSSHGSDQIVDLVTKYQKRRHPLIWPLAVTTIITGPFLFSFDIFVLATNQPRILRDLGQVSKLIWMVAAYVMAAMATAPLSARLYAIFNVKYVFIGFVLLINIGLAVDGAAPNMDAFIVGRIFAGVGGIGAYLGAMNMIALTTTIQQRPLYNAIATLAYGIGAVVAPVIGGAFADNDRTTWRWGFYILMCFCGLFAPGYLFLLPSESRATADTTIKMKLNQIDALGNLLWIGATVSLIIPISSGGGLWAWSSGRSIGTLVTSGVLWILFVLQQVLAIGTHKTTRILPIELLKNSEIPILFLESAVASSAGVGPVFLVTFYLQFVRNYSALHAATVTIPMLAIRTLFVLINGAAVKKFGYPMPWFFAGAAIALAASAPFLTVTITTSIGLFWGLTTLLGIGLGMYSQSAFTVSQARVKPQEVPQATGFIMLSQMVGPGIGASLALTIFFNRASVLISKTLPNVTVSLVQETILGGLSTELTRLPAAQRKEVLKATTQALDEAWYLFVISLAVSLILSLFLKKDRLFGTNS